MERHTIDVDTLAGPAAATRAILEVEEQPVRLTLVTSDKPLRTQINELREMQKVRHSYWPTLLANDFRKETHYSKSQR